MGSRVLGFTPPAPVATWEGARGLAEAGCCAGPVLSQQAGPKQPTRNDPNGVWAHDRNDLLVSWLFRAFRLSLRFLRIRPPRLQVVKGGGLPLCSNSHLGSNSLSGSIPTELGMMVNVNRA